MARMLADAKTTLILLDELPADPNNPTAAELEGENASCVVGKAGFSIGAGTPNTEADTPLCTEGESQIPVSKTYEANMNVYRYFDADGQIDPEEDFFFQALKDFGSEVHVAVREGGKGHKDPIVEGDEVSIYTLIAGGMGRSTDGAGYTKRVAHVTVAAGWEDKTVASGGGGG